MDRSGGGWLWVASLGKSAVARWVPNNLVSKLWIPNFHMCFGLRFIGTHHQLELWITLRGNHHHLGY